MLRSRRTSLGRAARHSIGRASRTRSHRDSRRTATTRDRQAVRFPSHSPRRTASLSRWPTLGRPRCSAVQGSRAHMAPTVATEWTGLRLFGLVSTLGTRPRWCSPDRCTPSNLRTRLPAGTSRTPHLVDFRGILQAGTDHHRVGSDLLHRRASASKAGFPASSHLLGMAHRPVEVSLSRVASAGRRPSAAPVPTPR